jgi:hypothetical protein
MAQESKRRWSQEVGTVSTYPPKGLFTKDAETIAREMSDDKISPKGIGSGIRMIQLFINRAGKNLSLERRQELEKAKQIMQERLESMRNASLPLLPKANEKR